MNKAPVLLVRPRLMINESRVSYPVGLLHIFSSLGEDREKRLFDADYFSQTGMDFQGILAELDKVIAGKSGLIAGISCDDASLLEALYYAEHIKRRIPDAVTIFGGPGVFFNSEKILGAFGALIDVIVRGECNNLGEILDALGTPPRAANLPAGILRDSRRLDDLDLLPRLVYEGHDPRRYLQLERFTVFPLFVGTGCAKVCKFCSTTNFWNGGVRYKSVASLIEEVQRLSGMGVKSFDLLHDNLFTDMNFIRGFARALIDERLGVEWSAQGRVDDFDISAIPLLKRSGCACLSFGIESGSARGQIITGKKLDLDETSDKITRVAESGIKTVITFIYNFPGDTGENFDETLEMALALKARRPKNILAFFNYCILLSGSLFCRAKDKKISLNEHLFAQIDLPGDCKEKVIARPDIFNYFYHFGNVTGLKPEFLQRDLHLVVNTYPLTLKFLLEKGVKVSRVCRYVQDFPDLAEGLAAFIRTETDDGDALLEDTLFYERLLSDDGGVAAPRVATRLLGFAHDFENYPNVVRNAKSYYLDCYEPGCEGLYVIGEEDHARLSGLAGCREKLGIAVRELLQS